MGGQGPIAQKLASGSTCGPGRLYRCCRRQRRTGHAPVGIGVGVRWFWAVPHVPRPRAVARSIGVTSPMPCFLCKRLLRSFGFLRERFIMRSVFGVGHGFYLRYRASRELCARCGVRREESQWWAAPRSTNAQRHRSGLTLPFLDLRMRIQLHTFNIPQCAPPDVRWLTQACLVGAIFLRPILDRRPRRDDLSGGWPEGAGLVGVETIARIRFEHYRNGKGRAHRPRARHRSRKDAQGAALHCPPASACSACQTVPGLHRSLFLPSNSLFCHSCRFPVTPIQITCSY